MFTAGCGTLTFDPSLAKDMGTATPDATPDLADLDTPGSVWTGMLLSAVSTNLLFF